MFCVWNFLFVCWLVLVFYLLICFVLLLFLDFTLL